MRVHTTPHRAGTRTRTPWVNRSIRVLDIPRPLLTCRLLGHRPTVDGYDPGPTSLRPARWVTCDRCGTRPEPQGDLDPAVWQVGDRYPGPWGPRGPRQRGPHTPGPWPTGDTWDLDSTIVLAGGAPGIGITVEVGSAGDDHALAVHLKLGWLGSLHLTTKRLGTWWQRRLNATGYEAQAVALTAHGGRLRWRLWTPLDPAPGTPRWRHGSARIRGGRQTP